MARDAIWGGDRTVALIFPGENSGEIFIVAHGFAIGRLMFLAEMTAARFVTGERVGAHQFGKFEEISDASRPFQRLIEFFAVARDAYAATWTKTPLGAREFGRALRSIRLRSAPSRIYPRGEGQARDEMNQPNVFH